MSSAGAFAVVPITEDAPAAEHATEILAAVEAVRAALKEHGIPEDVVEMLVIIM